MNHADKGPVWSSLHAGKDLYWELEVDKKITMKEAFLHFVWARGLFDTHGLVSDTGETIEIEHRGEWNHNSGPDFFGARIRINGRLWIGNVEIHIRASDWYKHGHQHDLAYQNTILHVVYENDKNVELKPGFSLPCIALGNRIQRSMYSRYEDLSGSLGHVPCYMHMNAENSELATAMFEKSTVERLFKKSEMFLELYHQNTGDWETTFYIFLSRYLGYKINGPAMEALARNCPLSLILRNSDRRQTLEALFFGQAGLLPARSSNNYVAGLIKEYAFLRHKYGLEPMNPAAWKFLRMRPANFPTIRIAQLCDFLFGQARLFAKVLEAHKSEVLQELFAAKASVFWETHYHFRSETIAHSAELGSAAIHGILVNVVAVAWYAYGRVNQRPELQERALSLLQQLPSEENRYTRYWSGLGVRNSSAFDSQGILGLQELYCGRKRCLECKVGMRIISG